MPARVAFALSAAPAKAAAESRASVPKALTVSKFSDCVPVLFAQSFGFTEFLRISEDDVQHPVRDWTRAHTWLQCVARFSKDNPNE